MPRKDFYQRISAVGVAVAIVVAGAGQASATAAVGVQPRLEAPRGAATRVSHVDSGRDATVRYARRDIATPRWPAAGLTTADSGPVRAATRGGRAVRMRVFDEKAAGQAGIRGLLLGVEAAGEPLSVSVDYSSFAPAYGGGWASRLHLVALPHCALLTPADARCAATDIPSTNDFRTQRVSGDLPAGTELVALTAAVGGGAGSFAATPFAPSSSWSAGGSSGGFGWSYPIGVPPTPAGPTPTVGLSYSSQSIDGLSAATNNQPSWVGLGFDYSPGFIERSYKACSDDMGSGANNTVKTGDLCWGPDNATMSLSGSGTELIKDSTGKWTPLTQDGSRVEHITSGGDYWRITTIDGIQYYFGLNHLTGWVSGDSSTSSAWSVPVFGNNSGEPCHTSTFSTSWCSQVWRWNLDYVVDVYGNTQSYWYAPESNNYGRNLTATTVSSYTRGGYLTHIDYGTANRSGRDTDLGASAHPPAQVVFAAGDRCLSSCSTHDRAHFPDTPWDQYCAASPCTGLYSPSFWSAKRLASITTQVWSGTAWRPVDSWTLTHDYPDPGDGTPAGMFLRTIVHKGLLGTAITLPAVSFDGVQLANRVSGVDEFQPMNWWRLTSIVTDSGAQIAVSYLPAECDGALPAPNETNGKRCYPVSWIPPGKTTAQLAWFNKYVVQSVTVTSATDTNSVYGPSRITTNYTYPNPPAWRHAVDNGLTPASRLTWSDWRGYDRVRTSVGDVGTVPTLSETLYLRGLNGDQKAAGGTRSVTVTDDAGHSVTDYDEYAGVQLQTTQYNGVGGPVLSRSTTLPWRSTVKASRTIGASTVNSVYVQPGAQVDTYTALDGGRPDRHTQSASTFNDADATIAQADDAGDLSTTLDDQCATYSYAPANTTVWLKGVAQAVNVTGLRCGTAPTKDTDIRRDMQLLFDGHAYNTAPTRGEQTQASTMTAWAAGTYTRIPQRKAAYDTAGRVVDSWDMAGQKTHTDYTIGAGGGSTRVTETNPMGWQSHIDLDPARGRQTASVDVNGKTTSFQHDSLGRLTAVWLPGRVPGTDAANTTYAYTLSATAPSVLDTGRLLPDGVSYSHSYQLFDAMLRPRQTQAPAPGGGEVITDAFYDTAGRITKAWGPYTDPATAPSGRLVEPANHAGDAAVPGITTTSYDGAGRSLVTTLLDRGLEKWHSSISYGGDRTDLTPATGGAASATVLDARGQTRHIRHYHGPTPTPSTPGSWDDTEYQYDNAGNLLTVIDGGDTWKFEYNIRGQLTSSTDPDVGTTTVTYDQYDRRKSTTDALGNTLTYTYGDSLSRLTQADGTGPAGTTKVTYTYDGITGAKGMLTAQSRWVGTDEYKTATTAIDADYRPLTQQITIPASQGALAGIYTFRATYNADGSTATTTMPAAGGLAQETLAYGYDSLGGGDTLAGLSSYVTDTQYTAYGQPALTTFGIHGATGGGLVQIQNTFEEATKRLVRSLVASTTAIADRHYDYNDAGDLIKIADTPTGGPADTQCFTTDYLSRLTQAWTPADGNCQQTATDAAMGGAAPYWQTWDFDAHGNRKTQTDHNTPTGQITATYQAPADGSQPHTLDTVTTTDITGTRTADYTFNKVGQTIARPGPTGPQSLTWDAEGNLASLSDSSGNASYVYTVDGQRLISRDPTGTTLNLPGMQLRVPAGTNSAVGTRYYSWNGATVAQRTAAGVTWLIGDTQGTSNIAVNAATLAVTRRYQTPYGGPRGTQPQWVNDKGFLGGTKDPTGLTHLGAREYDPATGRFISRDSYQQLSDPTSIGGYSYAGHSPINQSDPGGTDPCPGGGGGCGYPDTPPTACPTPPICTAPAPAPPPPPPPAPKPPTPHPPNHGGKPGKGPNQNAYEELLPNGYVVVVVYTPSGCEKKPTMESRPAPDSCTVTWDQAIMGLSTSCDNVPNATGDLCYIGKDQYFHDLYGHSKCTKVGPCSPPSNAPVTHGTVTFLLSRSVLPQYCNPVQVSAFRGYGPGSYIEPDEQPAESCHGNEFLCGLADDFSKVSDTLGKWYMAWCQACSDVSIIMGFFAAGSYLAAGDVKKAGNAFVSTFVNKYAGKGMDVVLGSSPGLMGQAKAAISAEAADQLASLSGDLSDMYFDAGDAKHVTVWPNEGLMFSAAKD